MPAIIEKRLADGTTEIIEYVHPDRILHFYTERSPGEIGRSVLVKCLDDDSRTTVFNGLNEAATVYGHDKEELEALCVPANEIGGAEDEPWHILMNDVDEGLFLLVINHVYVGTSAN